MKHLAREIHSNNSGLNLWYFGLTMCHLLRGYRRFGGARYLYLMHSIWRQVSPNLHGDINHVITTPSSKCTQSKGGYTLVTSQRIVTPYRDSVEGTRDRVTYQKLVTRNVTGLFGVLSVFGRRIKGMIRLRPEQVWTCTVTLHVHTYSGLNRIIPLMRRPNTDSTPNKPVTLAHNQLLIRYAVTSPVHTVTIRCYDTRYRYKCVSTLIVHASAL